MSGKGWLRGNNLLCASHCKSYMVNRSHVSPMVSIPIDKLSRISGSLSASFVFLTLVNNKVIQDKRYRFCPAIRRFQMFPQADN